jgi:hypothetical protein
MPMKVTDIYYDVVKGGEKVIWDILPFTYNIEPLSGRDSIANPNLLPNYQSTSMVSISHYFITFYQMVINILILAGLLFATRRCCGSYSNLVIRLEAPSSRSLFNFNLELHPTCYKTFIVD